MLNLVPRALPLPAPPKSDGKGTWERGLKNALTIFLFFSKGFVTFYIVSLFTVLLRFFSFRIFFSFFFILAFYICFFSIQVIFFIWFVISHLPHFPLLATLSPFFFWQAATFNRHSLEYSLPSEPQTRSGFLPQWISSGHSQAMRLFFSLQTMLSWQRTPSQLAVNDVIEILLMIDMNFLIT